MTLEFSRSPLFQAASREIQRAARREFHKSEFGRLLREVDRNARSRRGSILGYDILQRYGRKMDPRRAVQDLLKMPFGTVAGELQRYARGGLTKVLVDALLSNMGPVGKLLKTITDRPAETKGGLNQQLQAAANLLQAYGFHVTAPKGATVKDVGQGVEGLVGVLESLGYTVIPPEQEAKAAKPGATSPGPGGKPRSGLPFGIGEKTTAGTPRKIIRIRMASGRVRQFPVDHPIVTGVMVRAESKHVWEYGYDVETASLYVRFHQSPTRINPEASGPGSLYRYSEVTPEMFLGFYEAKGKNEWIWDHLRIRGTASGHRKPYQLVGIMNGYVPRKATLRADGEWYIKRELQVDDGKWLRSQLPNERVRYLEGRPWSGRPEPPDRGEPNRGKPTR